MEWEKKTNETGKAYMWFCRYRDMGWERSIAKVVQKHGGNSATLFRWSSKYDWVSRAEAYDDYLDEKKREAQEDEIIEASRRHAELAQKFIDLVLKRLHTLDPDEISTRDLALFAEMAVKIERDALGMAKKFEVTQNIQQDDKLADDLIKRSKELLERDSEITKS